MLFRLLGSVMHRKKILDAIAKGMQIANETSEKWTGGEQLNNFASEHLMSVKIAETVFNNALREVYG